MSERLFEFDRELAGDLVLAGVDEVGRGPWAGPVVAGAVILRPGARFRTADSKSLTREAREAIAAGVWPCVASFGIGFVGEDYIDAHGILNATKRAMEAAIGMLTIHPDKILVDGRVPVKCRGAQTLQMDKADSRSAAVATASILAKVARDRLMADYAGLYPEFGFGEHYGYGTASHQAQLSRQGACPIHRTGYRPVSEVRLFHGGIRKDS